MTNLQHVTNYFYRSMLDFAEPHPCANAQALLPEERALRLAQVAARAFCKGFQIKPNAPWLTND